MPTFDLVPQFSQTFFPQTFSDPPDGTRPSRLTAVQGRPHLAWTGKINIPFEVFARLDQIGASPGDADSGGLVYSAWFIESPELPNQPTQLPGFSSRIKYTPYTPGHYLLCVRRVLPSDGTGTFYSNVGGAVLLHIDILDPLDPAPP